jgi:ABC-type transport system involved in multi-copper enzyme maturation permease subunit
VFRGLFWKEWHEHRWKLAFGCVILAGYTVVGLGTRMESDRAVLFTSALGAAFLLPILAGMDLVAAERADGSLRALLSLPVRPWVVLAVKILMGALTCIVPQATAMLISCLIAGDREVSAAQFVRAYLGSMAFSLCLLTWMLCLGIRQPSDARTALVGIGVFAVWFIVHFVSGVIETYTRVIIAPVATPFGFVAVALGRTWRMPHLIWLVTGQALACVCLFAWAARRLGKLGRTRG